MTEQELKTIGEAMAIQLYRLQTIDCISTKEACALLGCKRTTLYGKGIPHNGSGWSKKAILEYLSR